MDPIYVDLASESEDPNVTQIASLCMKCEKQGVTRLLMTHIPHYKEIIVSSFECEHCGNKNTVAQQGAVQDSGIKYELMIQSQQDLKRQVVKSENATITIPELEFEIPAEKGEITCIEGLITRAVEGLNQDQHVRRVTAPDLAEQIDDFLQKLKLLLEVEQPFRVLVDDPSGNSYVESLVPQMDPQLHKKLYKRTALQNRCLGFYENSSDEVAETIKAEEEESKLDVTGEVLTFSALCNKCSVPVQTCMKVVAIPYFKEVIIMATNCDNCGYRTNEVRSGSGVCPKGKKITLSLQVPLDLARDILKSDTCDVEIPELDIHVGAGILGGKFTTVEGLLVDIKEDLAKNPFLAGDSSTPDAAKITQRLIETLEQVISCERKVTLILNDPAGNSHVQNTKEPEDDPQLVTEEYERTFEDNESLGLNDMKTENYEVPE